jgi:AcrR family transcriptional regulator
VDRGSTRDRVLGAALSSFGTKGYDATSLDQIAAELGVRKQTILYYFPTKADLLDAVVDHAAADLTVALEAAVTRSGPSFARVEGIVRSVFRLALRRPELLGLLREVSRLGPPTATRLVVALEPLVPNEPRAAPSTRSRVLPRSGSSPARLAPPPEAGGTAELVAFVATYQMVDRMA